MIFLKVFFRGGFEKKCFSSKSIVLLEYSNDTLFNGTFAVSAAAFLLSATLTTSIFRNNCRNSMCNVGKISGKMSQFIHFMFFF